MTKGEFVEAVASRAGLTKADAEKSVEAVFGTLVSATKGGEKVAWPGFGSFSVAVSAARDSRNPATGETVKVPARNKMKFTAAAGLKAELNK